MNRVDWVWLCARRAYQVGSAMFVFYFNAKHEYEAAIGLLVLFVVAWNWD